MDQIPAALVEHLRSYFSGAFSGHFHFWARGLVAFVVIGAVVWLVSFRRNKPFSIRALAAYLFPPKLYQDPTARITHWHYALSFVFWGPLLALVGISAITLANGVRDALAEALGPRTAILDSVGATVVAQVAALFLSGSFAFYWIHYAMHKVPLLWSFHRAHHSVEALTLPANARAHPVEGLLLIGVGCFSGLVTGLALYAMGMDELHAITLRLMAAYAAWEVVTGILQHSHVPLSFGWLDRILVSPVLHQIHHSTELRHRDKNLCDWFRLSIWDWIFGTLYLPKKGLDDEYRWGLNDQECGENNPHLTLRAFYLEPFSRCWSELRKSLAMRPAR